MRARRSFYILYGDVLTNVNLSALINVIAKAKQIVTMASIRYRIPRSVVLFPRIKNGIVQRFVEKPAKPDGNWAFSGVMVATPGNI